jgi:hypothetical protein
MAICVSLHAQTGKTISIQLRDGRSGKLIAPSNFLLRVDRHDTVRNEWLKMNDDGTAAVTIPDDIKEISLQATYDSGMEYYVNCDAAKLGNQDRVIWYPVDMIMKTGVVTPNECGKPGYAAHPGEFVVFVRKRNVLDHPHD